MLSTLGYPALLLGVLVFVHELGHFLVAKAFNVKVLTFSLGFGPKLIGFRRGETEYRLSALPLGGYVKMAQENEYDELPAAEANRGLLAQAPWKRALIFVAGPAMNLVFPVLVYFFAYLGVHDAYSTRIGSVEPGLPAAEAHLLPGDHILAVDGERVLTFDELRTALQPRYDKDIALTVDRDGKQFVTHITPAKNLETNPLETVPRGVIGIAPSPRVPVIGVPAGSKAEAAGLKTFDRILTINGTPVHDEGAFLQRLRQVDGTLELQVARSLKLPTPGANAQAPELVTVKVDKDPAGEGYAALGVERSDLYVSQVLPKSAAEKLGLQPGDRLVSVNGKPLKSQMLFSIAMNALKATPFSLTWHSGTQSHTAQVQQAKIEGKDELEGNAPELGVVLHQQIFSDNPNDVEKVKRTMSAGEALTRAVHVVPEVIRQTGLSIVRLISGSVPMSTVGGPIMIAQVATRSAEQGLESFLALMGLISVNLGMMNLLPIPVLDGFHLLSAIWEAIRRRPIPVRVREVANLVGLAMLVALMFVAFKNDITRLLAG